MYQFLQLKHFGEAISVKEILESNNYDIGLLGPGNGCLTQMLELSLGWIDALHTHSILHDAFGRFYNNYSLNRGYSYLLPEKLTTKNMKSNPLCGQTIGVMYCLFKKIII